MLCANLLTRHGNTCKDQNYFEELHYNVLPVLVFMVYSIELVYGYALVMLGVVLFL